MFLVHNMFGFQGPVPDVEEVLLAEYPSIAARNKEFDRITRHFGKDGERPFRCPDASMWGGAGRVLRERPMQTLLQRSPSLPCPRPISRLGLASSPTRAEEYHRFFDKLRGDVLSGFIMVLTVRPATKDRVKMLATYIYIEALLSSLWAESNPDAGVRLIKSNAGRFFVYGEDINVMFLLALAARRSVGKAHEMNEMFRAGEYILRNMQLGLQIHIPACKKLDNVEGSPFSCVASSQSPWCLPVSKG